MILSLSDTAHPNYTLRTLHSSSTCTGPVLISIFITYVLISSYPGLLCAALVCPRFPPPFLIAEFELRMLTCVTSIQLCSNIFDDASKTVLSHTFCLSPFPSLHPCWMCNPCCLCDGDRSLSSQLTT